MKKLLCILLALTMAFLFVSCAGNNPGKEETQEAETTATQMQTEENEDKQAGLFSSFEAETVDREKVDQSILKGKKVTMINIWATFCGPCISEMPDLQKLSEDYSDKGFQIIGIVCDIKNDGGVLEDLSVKEAKDILDRAGAEYINLLPSEELNEIKLNEVYSIPETLFVDENGNVIGDSYVGSKSYEQWAQIIDSVLEQVG